MAAVQAPVAPSAPTQPNAPVVASARLNDLLIEIHRSLLQYAAEAYPWASGTAEQRAKIIGLAAKSESSVGELAKILTACGAAIDFGVFPDYSRWHFVSASYLTNQIIRHHEGVLSACRTTAEAARGDDSLSRELWEIAATQSGVLEVLRCG